MKSGAGGPRVWTGAALLAVLVGTCAVIFFLDSIERKFVDRFTVVAVLPGEQAILPGTPVWLGGKEVGRVSAVRLLPVSSDTLTRVAALLELPTRVRPYLRRDSGLRTTTLNPLSGPVLAISPGSPAAPPLSAGDTLRTRAAASTTDLIARVSGVYASFDSLRRELEPVAGRARSRALALRRLSASVDDAHGAFAQLRGALDGGTVGAMLRDTALSAGTRRARADLAALSAAMRERAARFEALLPRAAAESGTQRAAGDSLAGDVAGRLRTLAARLDSLRAGFSAADGTLPRLARDSALAVALTGVRAALDSLVADAKRHPLRYVF